MDYTLRENEIMEDSERKQVVVLSWPMKSMLLI